MTLVAGVLRTVACRGTRITGRLGAYLLFLCISVAPSTGVRAADQPPAPQPAPVSVDELERLVHTLQDDTARTKLIQELRPLLTLQRGPQKGKPAPTPLFGHLSPQTAPSS